MVAEIELNWDALNVLCERFCTLNECASSLKISTETIQRKIKAKYGMTFKEYARTQYGRTQASLRSIQLQIAFDKSHPKQVEMIKFISERVLPKDEVTKEEIYDDLEDEQIESRIEELKNKLIEEKSIDAEFKRET